MKNWKRPRSDTTAVPVVVDTSFWIDYARGRLTPAELEQIERLARFGAVVLYQLVWLELVVGFRSIKEQGILGECRAVSRWDAIQADDGIKAEGFAATLRGKGRNVGASDLLIMAAADRMGAQLIHHDSDFTAALSLREFAHLKGDLR